MPRPAQSIHFVLPHPRAFSHAQAWWQRYVGHLELLASQGWDLQQLTLTPTRCLGRFTPFESPRQAESTGYPVLLSQLRGRPTPRLGWWLDACQGTRRLESAGLQVAWLELIQGKLLALVCDGHGQPVLTEEALVRSGTA